MVKAEPINTNLPEDIANLLRREILRGELVPGGPLKERQNAERLGISRTPMREATRILAKEGLVDLRHGRSPLIANPSLKEVSDAIDVLRVLEVLSGELACEHATKAELVQIRKLHEKLVAAMGRADPLDVFEMDMDFHVAIANASHNLALAESHRTYLSRLWRARFLSSSHVQSRKRVLDQHGVILTALEERDAKCAAENIWQHLEHLHIRVRSHFAENEDK